MGKRGAGREFKVATRLNRSAVQGLEKVIGGWIHRPLVGYDEAQGRLGIFQFCVSLTRRLLCI